MTPRFVVALTAAVLLVALVAPGARSAGATRAIQPQYSTVQSATLHVSTTHLSTLPLSIHADKGKLTCPPHSHIKGTECFCNTGYAPKSGKCVKVKKPKKPKKPKKTPTPEPTPTQQAYDAGTDFVSGSMGSDYTMTMTGALSVGHTTNLDWSIPAPQSIDLAGYTEKIDEPVFTWSQTPDSITKSTDSAGRAVYVVHWNTPQDNTVITMTEKLHITLTSTLTAFQSSTAFPVTGVPSDVQQQYLQPRDLLKLPDSINSVLTTIKSGATTEQQVVNNAANWVASYLKYDPTKINSGYDASSTFATKTAACRGYDDLLAGVLQLLGIPTMSETGWVSAIPLTLPGPAGSTETLQWSNPGTAGELHTWLNIYFPGTGWVPFDPQYEKFFVDTRHIGFVQSPDAGLPSFDIAYDQYTDNGQNVPVFGAALGKNPDGSNRYSDYPADGIGSTVTVDSQPDNMQLSYVKWVPDITDKVLFSR